MCVLAPFLNPAEGICGEKPCIWLCQSVSLWTCLRGATWQRGDDKGEDLKWFFHQKNILETIKRKLPEPSQQKQPA